ncbi:MAG: TIGR03435 family protein [Vicinamibacterales bacterium]
MRNTGWAIAFTFIGATLLVAAGQQGREGSDGLPAFEVASVKQDRSGEQPTNNWQRSPGRVNYQNSQVLQLLRAAWGDFSLRVEGAPDWVAGERYDVDVRFPVDAPASTITLMLRQLLIERFRLAAHLEAREVPMYGLSVIWPAGSGPAARYAGMRAGANQSTLSMRTWSECRGHRCRLR